MKRPLAYITAPWGENEYENTENAARWCRQVYDAGFSPVCPLLFLPLFLEDGIPQEHKDSIDMARDYLRRARVLVVCGGKVDETVKNDIATAERLRITATTLDAIAAPGTEEALEKAEADLAGGLHVFAGPLSGHPAQNPDGEVWSIGEGEFFPESDLSQEGGLSAPQFCYVIDGITEE